MRGAGRIGVILLACTLCMPLRARRTETFWEAVLRFMGISATPSGLRGEEDNPAGDIWMVDVSGANPHRLTSGGSYRFPLLRPNGNTVVALRHDEVVEVPLAGGNPSVLVPAASQLQKLVSFPVADAAQRGRVPL